MLEQTKTTSDMQQKGMQEKKKKQENFQQG